MADENAQRRAEVGKYFVDGNVEGEPEVVMSPSGRFRLTIRRYRTAPGRWDYSRGTVARVVDGVTVCDIQRNLEMFHHSFVTKGGREYLITGRSYMSQTVVDLDGGQEFEPAGDHYNGGAFCWACCYLSPDGNTLAVDGCLWGCPYEYRFFDFSDPSRGWTALPIAGVERIEHPSDKRAPQWLDGSTFECFQLDEKEKPQERTRVQRRGSEMVVIEHCVSETEQKRRDDQARAEAEQDAWWESFRSSDPMYQRLVALVRRHDLPCDNLDWQPGGHQLVLWFRRREPQASADLEWDIDKRALLVRLYKVGSDRARSMTLEPTLDGIEAGVALIAQAFE
ncbi:MAG: hypothetical protein IT384_26190 [Deltaproteobacteria bacterium]|nr:hypothetical protein [Deltaproteobacteria bacterium]